jgi:hypothetical protein
MEDKMSNLFRYKFSLLFTILITFLILSCDKDDNNPTGPDTSSDSFLYVHFLGDSTKVLYENLPKIDADGEEAIQLSSFVDTTLISMYTAKSGDKFDRRVLFGYRCVGGDGFYAGIKGYSDISWAALGVGHIMTASRNVIFPDDKIDLPGAYNVKETRHIYIYRKFDVDSLGTTNLVELQDIESSKTTIENHDGDQEAALPLAAFIEQVVVNPSDYTYNLRSVDDYGPDALTWAQLQTGYWLLESEKTIFTDTFLEGGKYKLKELDKIVVCQ